MRCVLECPVLTSRRWNAVACDKYNVNQQYRDLAIIMGHNRTDGLLVIWRQQNPNSFAIANPRDYDPPNSGRRLAVRL